MQAARNAGIIADAPLSDELVVSSVAVLGFINYKDTKPSWTWSSSFVHHPSGTAIMPVTNFSHPDPYTYQTGFDSYHE